MMKAVGFILLCLGACAFADEEDGLTPCQEDRARRLNATTTEGSILHLVPECDENGDYKALQCFTNNDWCVCYRRNGENIGTPSMKIKSCDCVRAQDDAKSAGDAYVPKCDRSGYYKPLQCTKKECWCVDKEGNVTTEPTSEPLKCSEP